MVQPMTIAVAYASVGAGHRVAAEALSAEFEARDENVRVELLDAIDDSAPGVSGNLLTSTFTGASAGVYDAIWASPRAGSLLRRLGGPFVSAALSSFSRHLIDLKPDVVVCTHAAAAVIATRAVLRGKASFDVVNVATDFGVHGFWPRQAVSLFCVADTPSAESLVERGFDANRVVTTGIPVRQQFSMEYDREAARKHFGLPLERRVILALAGSTMPGPYERFKEALAVSMPALATLPQTTVAIVTGHDEFYAEELRARSKGFGTTNVHVFGFVEHMAPLMASATLGLAKPGGSVCAECMASGLPLVLVGPAAGQERANASALTEGGSAVFAADPRTIAEHARKVISRPARLKALKDGTERMARPFAAADVVDGVLGLLPRVASTT